MAEPAGAKTVGSLVLEIAELIGIAYYGDNGQEEALVPINEHDLNVCKKIVNNGIRQFISDAPKEGWRWQRRLMQVTLAIETTGTATSGTSTTLVDSELAGTYANDYFKDCVIELIGGTGQGEFALVTGYTGSSGTFTFSGGLSESSTPDTTSEYAIGHRYKLPDNFGGTADGEISWIRGTNRGTPIAWVDESMLREVRETSLTTGYPSLAALRAFGRRQYELVVWPGPIAADTLEFPYTLYFDDLDIASGSATSGGATTLVDSSIANRYALDYFKDWTLTVISGTGKYGTATVTGYTGTSGTFAFSALSNSATPDSTSRYMVESEDSTHPAGFQFDNYVLIVCKAQAEAEQDDVVAGWTEKYNMLALPKAYDLNARLSPRKLGKNLNAPTFKNRWPRYGRYWKDVTYT